MPSIAAALAACVSLAPVAALLLVTGLASDWADLRGWIAETPSNSLISSASAAAIMTFVAAVLGRELAGRSRIGVYADALGMLAFLLPSALLGVGIIAAGLLGFTGRSTQA